MNGNVKKKWTEDDVMNALSEVAMGSSVRSCALKYNMSEALLRTRFANMKSGKQEGPGSGRKTALDSDVEKKQSPF